MKITIEVPDTQDLALNVSGQNNPVYLHDGDKLNVTSSGTIKLWSRIKPEVNEALACVTVS